MVISIFPAIFYFSTSIEFILWTSFGIISAFILLIAILKNFFIICPPNQVVVVSGKAAGKRRNQEGYRLAFGGLVFRIPILEEVSFMPLSTISLSIAVNNAYSKGGIVLQVNAVANVKISSDRTVIHNAIERFLERDLSEIRQTAQDTLEGNLREVLATLTPEEVNEDRLKFARKLTEVAEEDLKKLGLHLDTLKIQHVSDNKDYLNSIGRRKIAEVLRDAEIAEYNANREAQNAVAEGEAQAKVAKERAEAEVAKARNALLQLKAELEAKARSEEERTEAAALEARAKAEQELQAIRTELEALRLQAEQVVPAQAQREAQELLAKGDAAPISERGKAIAQSLQMVAEAWKSAGTEAQKIFVIQQLDEILASVVESVKGIQIQKVNLLDSGEGRVLPNYIRAYPQIVSELFKTLYSITGIDISGVLIEGRDSDAEGASAQK